MATPDWFHPFDQIDLERLRTCSVEARWLMLEIFGAELGTKHGLVQVRPVLACAEGGIKQARFDELCRELETAGLMLYDRQNKTAYHLGSLLRHGATNDKHREGWRRQLMAASPGIVRDAALAELDGQDATATVTTTATTTEPIDRVSIPYAKATDTVSKSAKQQEIDPQPLIDAYNELCTRLPACKGTDKQRTQASKALAKEPDIELWRSRFYAINQSEHHTGRTQANWFASFGWCIDYPDKLDPLVHKFKPPAQQQPQHDRRFDELEEARERNRQFKIGRAHV